jgi:hypothetical protein
LEKAIAGGYFEALGVTALWISPPVRNVWNSGADLGGPKTGYHGYWAQDFLDIDPHLTSRRSLDGAREYPDSREGRMQHYRDFVTLAHAHGLKSSRTSSATTPGRSSTTTPTPTANSTAKRKTNGSSRIAATASMSLRNG